MQMLNCLFNEKIPQTKKRTYIKWNIKCQKYNENDIWVLIQMSQIKQFKEFSTGNKLRDLISTEMYPTIQKIQSQWKKIRRQMDEYRLGYQIMMKFDNQKDILQKNIKEMRKELTDSRTSFAVMKSDVEINQTKNNSNYITLKQELMSFQRNLVRRDETLTNYDRKINTLAEGSAKSQNYINDRLGIFEQKYKKLAKQTLQMTKDVKKDFQNAITNNQVLKSELLHKIRTVQKKQHAIDLYLSEREQIATKLNHLLQNTHNFVTFNEFEEYKKIHNGFLLNFERKIENLIQNLLSHDTKLQLAQIKIKFAQIQGLKQKTNQLQEIKKQIVTISKKISGIESMGDEKMQRMRVQTEQMEEKIIDAIDKKMQTLEGNLQQQINTQTAQNLEDQLKIFKSTFQSQIFAFLNEEIKKLESKQPKVVHSNPDQIKIISHQLHVAQEQRKKIEGYCNQIKTIARDLQDKLNLFGHRITVCKSNIEIFTQTTNKQLKKLNILKEMQQNQNEQIGKILSEYLQTLMIIVSIQLEQEQPASKQTFVTFKDGIVYQSNCFQTRQNSIAYRRNCFRIKQLKQSLLYELLNLTDDLILNHSFLKINLYKPSDFFRSLKSNLQQREKGVNRSCSLLNYSPTKMNRRPEEQQESIIDFRRQSEQLFNRCETTKKMNITITNGNIPWPIDRHNSVIQRRYKGKKSSNKVKQQAEERNCITATRSHKKTKVYLS